MMKLTLPLALLASLLWQAGCSPDTGTDGDGDVDADVDSDADSDADGDGGDECPPEAECCHDSECTNGIYCDGLEVCDRGVCEAGFPIDCDDGLACTTDSCNEASNRCGHEPVHAECDDGDLCNGQERCAPTNDEADDRGCIATSPMVCDDGDPCTDDYCEEDECRVQLRDSDDDGFGDADCALCDPEDPTDCESGTDCDDTDPDIYPGAVEVCDDGEDNNCDRVVDYADEACLVPNDGCADAIALVEGVRIHSSLRGTAADIDSSCSEASHLDVAFTFTIGDVQDVELTVDSRGSRDLTVALSSDCGNAAADLRCTTGRDFTQINRSLAAGTYTVIVSAEAETDFSILFDHDDPAPRPEGDQCATAIDVSAGGTFTGTTTGYDPDYESACGEATDRDATFAVTVTETTAMDLSVDGPSDLAVAVQSSCGVVATEVTCFEGDPAEGWVSHLAPGTHFIIVKSATEVDFDLTVTFMPTAADACADTLDISAGGTYRGSTIGLAADIDTACGSDTGPDGAYELTLTEEQDVTVDFRAPDEATTLSLSSSCGDAGAELRCSTGTDFQLRGRGLPAGTYYLIATGETGADFDFDLTISDPVARPPEDLCTGAIDVTGGGSFSGDTIDAENDYDSRCGSATDLDVAYVFDLAAAQAMDLTVTAGTGPVTVALQPDCGVVGTERSCLTTDTSATRHYRSLDAGTYYLVVKTPTADTFDFTLGFGPPEPTLLDPVIPSAGHTTLTASSSDDGQYDIDISPLTFPFNDESYDRVSVGTNGYIRFGNGSYPSASSFSDTYTDIDSVYPAGTAQVSWLGEDGEAGTAFTYDVDTSLNRVVITYTGHTELGSTGENDVQIILHTDTGDIQISYVDCAFDFDEGSDHWAIGVSEPAVAGGSLQSHDFTAQPPATVVSFGPGAISQMPEHTAEATYAPLDGRAIYFARSGSGWDVLVDDIPL